MKVSFFVCSVLLALSACATDPGWTGYRVNSKVFDGREQVRFDFRLDALPVYDGVKSVKENARLFATAVLKERGLCPRGFDGPDSVAGDRNSGTGFFVVFCR